MMEDPGACPGLSLSPDLRDTVGAGGSSPDSLSLLALLLTRLRLVARLPLIAPLGILDRFISQGATRYGSCDGPNRSQCRANRSASRSAASIGSTFSQVCTTLIPPWVLLLLCHVVHSLCVIRSRDRVHLKARAYPGRSSTTVWGSMASLACLSVQMREK
jgi:hypothetical protein